MGKVQSCNITKFLIKDAIMSHFIASNLSIVVQGGLSPGNIATVATNCTHWRKLFPDAEIILSVSSADGMRLELHETHVVSIMPDPAVGSVVFASARILQDICDAIVVAADALPLPPIKSDSPAQNNANLQIAAAQRGLAVATKPFVLRVRSDLVFIDENFIDQWQELKSLPRGNDAVLVDRVLASNLYTLNPYTFERLPFHISDWFHFGRTEDLRLLWRVAPVSLADAVYYTTSPHHPASNLDERKMLCRLAVEQHIILEGIGSKVPDIILNYHNDWTSRERFLDILCDNFIITDLVAARCVFPKYAHDIGNPRKDIHCIGQEDWKALTVADDRRAVLLRRVEQLERPENIPFPRRYDVRVLATKSGQRSSREIMSSYQGGVLLHGPYDTLPRGTYLAKVHASVLQGPGEVELVVTAEAGRLQIGRRLFVLDQGAKPDLSVRFEIEDRIARKVELVMTTSDLPYVSLEGVSIYRISTKQPENLLPSMQTRVGVRVGSAMSTGVAPGYLLFGPYLDLYPGRYRCELTGITGDVAGYALWEVTDRFGEDVLARCRITNKDLKAGIAVLDFTVAEQSDKIEFRVRVSRASRFALDSIRLFVVEMNDPS